MKTVRTLAKILHYISKSLAFMYALVAFYSILCLLTKWSLEKDGDFFTILFPFTKEAILIGEYNIAYILFDFLMIFMLYAIFFMLLSNVFNVFTKQKLFTTHAIGKLKWFYSSNLIVPSIAAVLAYAFGNFDIDAFLLVALHFILGVFAYFFSEIFKQGVSLQKDQDLII
ncbi:DUF2975 domain-containing protein [Spongiimicrobium salis]|uniref:DUF2975 domain-containing protein n=1 Tax=Spongiimicrobium salis TaxID=1667022 RepID=UPI00374D746B